MTTTILMILAILFGILVSSILIYLLLNFDNLTFSHKRITLVNKTITKQVPQRELIKQNEGIYKNAEFVNKYCTSLEEFIINDEINPYDLRKLADLNGIQLEIREGWYSLIIELIKDLNAIGWDKKVSCIKEKWAKLHFYTKHEYNSPIHKIINKYSEKSLRICETCGRNGEIRYNRGWEYVACREHYLEIRGEITANKLGFNYKGNFYAWKEVKDASFRDVNFEKKYNFLKLEFKKSKIIHQNRRDSELNIFNDFIGYGNFLNQLPKNFHSLDYNYIQSFEKPEFCEICGYEAVFFDECECCENKSWIGYLNRWDKEVDPEENTEEKKYEHIKWEQIFWILDEGDIFEEKQNNYSKNPDYRILFTEAELKEAKEDLEND